MKISDNSLKVLEKRYFRKDSKGKTIENWEQMITRVAENISYNDNEKKDRYFKLLDSGLFLPNSPTLMNAGNDLQQLSACFVLPIEDSIDSIFTTIKNAALIHKSGGGTGFSFSRLREVNARVKTTNGVSSGPISFLKVFNSATDAVKQGGTRRGANMAILNVSHPQILEFITCKSDTKELTNFNISVALDDDFMKAVQQDDFYELVSPCSGKVTEKVKARDIYSLIIEMAHKNGEPGIIFLGRINDYNPTPAIGEIESTNPCGEQPLLPNEACNLGSINLSGFYESGVINYDRLREVIYDAVSFLDDVIDQSRFPLEEIEKMARANRKIGLGVMGWADLLFKMGISYNSQEAIELGEEVMEFIDFHAKKASLFLAQERKPFPNFKSSIYDRKLLKRKKRKQDWDSLHNEMQEKGVRNATVTTIAPTGTISMICDTSSGIEPQFSLVFVKNVMDGEKLLYINPVFEEKMKKEGLFSKELMEEVAETGSIQDNIKIPEKIRKIFVTSHDITPEWHIRMQAAFQKYTDNAVSKTINFHREATRDDIKTSFDLAYSLGCKGVTVYRDGSRENQVLNVGSTIKEKDKVAPRERPEIMRGITKKVETGCGHLYVTINYDNTGAFELFTQMGKVGGCASAQLEAVARLTSLCLRANIKVESLINQLRGIRCPSPTWNRGVFITSCADAVAKCLESYLALNGDLKFKGFHFENKAGESADSNESKLVRMSGMCPDCGCAIEFSEGCMKCNSCGWSKC